MPDWARDRGLLEIPVCLALELSGERDLSPDLLPCEATGDTAQDLLTVVEVAAWLKVSAKTIRRLVKRGDLRVTRVGRLIRVCPGEVNRLLAKE